MVLSKMGHQCHTCPSEGSEIITEEKVDSFNEPTIVNNCKEIPFWTQKSHTGTHNVCDCMIMTYTTPNQVKSNTHGGRN